MEKHGETVFLFEGLFFEMSIGQQKRNHSGVTEVLPWTQDSVDLLVKARGDFETGAPPFGCLVYLRTSGTSFFCRIAPPRNDESESSDPVKTIQTWTPKSGGALPVGLTALCGAAGLASAETMAAMLTARPGGGRGALIFQGFRA